MAEYRSFEEVLTSGEATRDIAVMLHKAKRPVKLSSSLGHLPSHALMEPGVGRASDFAQPGGFRRQYVASHSSTLPRMGDLIEFYSTFASSILMLKQLRPAAMPTANDGAEGMGRKTIGVTHTVLAILKSFVGSAVLFLPKGYDNGGLVLSNLLLMFMAIITVFCVGRLLECAQALKRRGLEECTYSEIARISMGPVGARAVNISLVLSQLGFCCGYMIFIASNVQGAIAVLRGDDGSAAMAPNVSTSTAEVPVLTVHDPLIPAWALLALQVPLFIALSWVRRLSYFAVSNLVADALIVGGLLAIFSVALYRCVNFPLPTVHLFSSRFPLFLGTAAFAFEGIGLVLPIFSSMHPHLQPRLPTLLRDTLALVVVIFCLFASTVYAAFGDDVRIIVADNLPPSVAVPVQLAYSCALALTYPLMLFPVITIIEGVLIPQSSRVEPSLKWRKNMLRAAIVVASAGIAWMGYETLDNFVALIGGFCSVPLAIIYPVLMHMLLARNAAGKAPDLTLSKSQWLANAMVGIIGVVIGVFASAFAIWTWPR